MTAMWVGEQRYDVPDSQVIPWLCGVHGVLGEIDLGLDQPISVVVDPSAADRPSTTYQVVFEGVEHDLAEWWVLPWVQGLAIHNGVADHVVLDLTAAERAQCVQALMVGHQLALFTYLGFTHSKETSA